MKKTDNYGLALYDKEDKMSITAQENSLNANMRIIDETLKEKADIEDIRTKTSELENDEGFISSIPSEYKTKTENDKLYQEKGNYLKEETDPTIPSYVKNIKESDIENWNNKSEFTGNYNDLTNKPTIPTVPTKVSQLENDKNYLSSIPLEYVTDTELTEKGYATESFVTNKIAEAELSGSDVDLSGLATKDELNSKVDKVKGKSLIDDTEIERLKTVTNYDDTEIKNSINSKANKTDIPTVPTNISSFTNDSGYLTSIPSEYITETELNNKGYLTSVPSDYKTKTENDSLYQAKGNYLTNYTETDPTVPSHVKNIKETDISKWNNKSEFSGNYNDLNNKPTIPTVPTNISAFNNDKGYLTEISEADKAEIVQMVIESLGGNPVYGYVDNNNNIIVTGNLADGEYTVMYEMEEGDPINIGNLVIDTTVDYSIKNNLTNCTNSNKATEVAKGGSYSATISANSGYELSSVTVTMGGIPVTVTNGVINIASVTGNIVITAVAEKKAVEIVNQLKNAIDKNGNPYNNGQGYKTNTRLSGSSGGESTSNASGMETTGFIRVNYGDTVYIKDISFSGAPNDPYMWFYKSDFSIVASNAVQYPANVFTTIEGTDGRVMKIDITTSGVVLDVITANAGVYYMRFAAAEINENSIITINEPLA